MWEGAMLPEGIKHHSFKFGGWDWLLSRRR